MQSEYNKDGFYHLNLLFHLMRRDQWKFD